MIGSPSLNSTHHHNLSSLSPTKSLQQQPSTNHLLNGIDILSCSLPQTSLNKYSNLSSSTPTPISFSLSSNSLDVHSYELWSNAAQLPSTSQQQLSSSLTSSNGNLNGQDSMIDLNENYSALSQNLLLPSRSNNSTLKRQKMIYHQKFGEFGVLEGQFTEPSGVAVNAQGDIIVADTNNHRIQIFDSNGKISSNVFFYDQIFLKDVFVSNLANVENVMDNYYIQIVLLYFVNQVILSLLNVVQHIKYKSIINTDNLYVNLVPMFYNIHVVSQFFLIQT